MANEEENQKNGETAKANDETENAKEVKKI